MASNEELKIGLFSGYFADMRNDLDYYIRTAYPEMTRKDVVDGTITLKIDLSFVRKFATCKDGELISRETVIPEIKYRISMDLKSKIETKGICVADGKEVIRGEHGFYIIPQEVVAGQMDMFNSFEEIEDSMDE